MPKQELSNFAVRHPYLISQLITAKLKRYCKNRKTVSCYTNFSLKSHLIREDWFADPKQYFLRWSFPIFPGPSFQTIHNRLRPLRRATADKVQRQFAYQGITDNKFSLKIHLLPCFCRAILFCSVAGPSRA